ncbi:2',5' RNA ligase domain protein [Burkholderia pseudomallei MSHR332]|nr:2',5' RNA ligase domain protein [Burkholderia pseudomallei MSHR332]
MLGAHAREDALVERERFEPQRERRAALGAARAVNRHAMRVARKPRDRHVRLERTAVGRQAERAQRAAHPLAEREQRRLRRELRDDEPRMRGARPADDALDVDGRHRAGRRERGDARAEQFALRALDRAEERDRHVQLVARRAPRAGGDGQRGQRVARRPIERQRDEAAQPVARHRHRAEPTGPAARTASAPEARPAASLSPCDNGPCSPHTSSGSTFASAGIVWRVNTGSATPAARWR